MNKYIKLMRTHHYIKNILILFPIIFSGMVYDTELLKVSFMGFLSFSFIASAIYVINDIKDVEQDKLHPIKCKRPIACGDIGIVNAKILAFFLFAVSAVINYFTCIHSGHIAWFLWGLYFLINLAYSFGLKKLPIIDVIILATGFLIRVLYGGAICNIEVSSWLCFTVIWISLYMSLGKRRNELVNEGECVRRVLKYYDAKVMSRFMYLFFVLTLSFYTLWCIMTVLSSGASIALYFTIPLIFFIMTRYSKNIEGKVDGDPINVLSKDKILIFSGISYAIVLFFILY